MAQIINKRNSNKIVRLINLQEVLIIYVQCLILNILVSCKCVLYRLHLFIKESLFIRKNKSSNFIKYSRKHDSSPKTTPRPLSNQHLGVHKYVKLKDLKFHYVESGCENEDIILLLHGFPDCWFSWRNQIPFLSQTYRVIALDLKGFNDSDKPMMRHKYHPKTVCNEIKLFLDALEISNVNIIGHDLGGLVAWYFTIIYPGYVSRLVQIATPHPNLYWNLSKNALTTKYWCNMIQLPFLPEIELTKYEEFIEKFHQNNNDSEVLNFSTQDILNTYKYIFNNRRDWRGPLNYFRNFLFYRVDPKFYFRCPITFIIGNKDPNYNLETIVKSGEFCKNSIIKIVEAAGHFPHQSHPNEVNDILMSIFRTPSTEFKSLDLPTEKGIVGRMIQKMYGVGQHYTSHYANLGVLKK